jgi:hypothetical protein
MPDNLLYRLSSTRGQTHLSVKVNDVSQQIYAVRQTGSQETEAWIACESGQTYTVHLDCQSYPRSPDYRGNYPDLNAELRLDGVMTEELTSVYRVKDGVVGMGNVVWKGTYTRRGFRKPFIFSSPVSCSCGPRSASRTSHPNLLCSADPYGPCREYRPQPDRASRYHPSPSPPDPGLETHREKPYERSIQKSLVRPERPGERQEGRLVELDRVSAQLHLT